jgi:hypothetical protein
MPVEIKELTIRATIVDTEASNFVSSKEAVIQQKEEIINACVKQVLKILETKKER